MAELSFALIIALDSIEYLHESGIIYGYVIDEEAIQEIAEIVIAGGFGKFALKEAGKIEIVDQCL